MKTKLLITSLSLIATSAYAQPSIPSVGIPPPTVRAEIPGQGMPSMPQPAMQRPVPQMNQPAMQSPMPQLNQSGPQPAVGATGGTGGNGGNGGLFVGNGGNGGSGATPKPSVTMYSGVGPLPANDVRAPTTVGASQSEQQGKVEAKARLEEAHENSTRDFANANSQSQIIQELESKALMPGGVKTSK